jgi:hypothetical protein
MSHRNGAPATAGEFRAALAQWREACRACRHHFAGDASAWPGLEEENLRVFSAADTAANRLMGLVLDAHDGWDGEAVAVDLGDTLLVVGPHQDDALSDDEPEVGLGLIAVDKSRVVRV